MTRLGSTILIMCLWVSAAYPQADFEQTNYRTIDLTSLGISGVVLRCVLSPDSRYAAVETQSRNSHLLYVVDLTTKEIMSIDPRTDLEGYAEWKNSPIAELYPRSDSDPRWYPGSHRGQQWLLFTSNGIDNQYDLFLFRPSTKSFVRVTEANEDQYEAKWSPDGEYLSYLTNNDQSELNLVSNMSRIFNEIEKLEMSYNHIPSLADVYSAAIFDRSKDIFFSTRDVILDYDWLSNGNIAALQASRNDSSAPRLYYIRRSGKAKFISDVPGSRSLYCGKYFPSVAVLSPQETDRGDLLKGTVFNENDLESSAPTGSIKGTSLGDELLTTSPLICGKEKYIVPIAGSGDDRLDFKTFTKGRGRNQKISIPSSGLILDIDMKKIENGRDKFNVIGAYYNEDRFGLFLFTFDFQIDENDIPIMEKNRFIEIGAQGLFCRYTGDVVAGDFQPGGGLWAELRFAEGLADFSAGLRLNYIPLTGSSSVNDVTFAAFFWSGGAYIRYSYPLSYEFQPYLSLGVGVSASNSRQFGKEPKKRQTPYYFEFAGGGAFTLNPRLNMHVILSYVKLAEDIDRLSKSPKTDSYITIGLGFSYTLLF